MAKEEGFPSHALSGSLLTLEMRSCIQDAPSSPWTQQLPLLSFWDAFRLECCFLVPQLFLFVAVSTLLLLASVELASWQLLRYVSNEIFWGPINSQPLQLASEDRETNELGERPRLSNLAAVPQGDPPFALWWGSTLRPVSVSWAPGRLWDLGGYYLTHSSRNWDAESCVKERPCWGSLRKGLNASFLPVVSTPDSRGLHFNPVNGEMWSHKNTSFSFLQNKRSIRTRVVWVSHPWAESCASWLLRCSFLIRSFLPVTLLLSALGVPLFRRKVGEVSGYSVSPPSPFIFFEKTIVIFLL